MFESCARQPSGQEAHSANLFRKEYQGCNEAQKPSCPAPQFNLPRRLSPPSHGSADRRLRPVIRRKTSQDEFYACDLGLRYPILQVARKRESLRMRLKACLFYVHLIHTAKLILIASIFSPTWIQSSLEDPYLYSTSNSV